ncbi:MAG: spermidine/putrescine ABC transporter substrate-binding protein [Syntrophales bacterium]
MHWRCLLLTLIAGMLLVKGGEAAELPRYQRLNVLIYSEYMDPNIPKLFEKETGIKVVIDTYESTDEMMMRFQRSGPANHYDLVVVTDYIVPVLAQKKLIQPLEHSKIPHLRNISKTFMNPHYDRENVYSLPYQWGTVGIMYRDDLMPRVDPTWGLIFNPDLQPGPFVLINSMRDLIGAALKYQGYSFNSRKKAELEKAEELIIATKKSRKYIGFNGGVGGKNRILAGDAAAAIVYNGDAVRAMKKDKRVGFVVPKEGSILWVDVMAVTAGAKNWGGAHAFINFILDPKIGAMLSDFNRYATPNAASLPLVRKQDRQDQGIYPSAVVMKKMEFLEDVGKDNDLYEKVWKAIKLN